jgi:predicted porin
MGAYLDTEETAAWAFGSAYQIGSARLAATYATFRLDSTHFRRYVIGIGGSYQFTPKLEFSLAHYNTQIEDVAFILGSKVYASKDIGNKDGGQSDQLVGLVEYDLSKRTALYGVINHAILKGAITPVFTGMTTQTSIALGVRHLF